MPPLEIKDGLGTGNTAQVDKNNRLVTASVASSPEHFACFVEGKAFSVNFSATPTGAGDCFFYMKNNSEDDIVVEGLSLKLAANEYIDVYLNDTNSPSGGADIIPTNLNSGSGATAIGTFQNGNDIIGLTQGDLAYRIYHASSNGGTYYNFESDITLQKSGVLTLYCETGTTPLGGYFDIYYTGRT
jgi:hypothetical protein